MRKLLGDLLIVIEYKNLSCVRGWDRKIRPEDHRLASQACRVMTNGDSEGLIFLSHLTQIMDSVSCSPLNSSFYIKETLKRLPENPEYVMMLHGDVILTLQ